VTASARSTIAAAVALAAVLLGIYGVVMSSTFAAGYEPTYAAGAEGLLRSGTPQLMRDSPLFAPAVGGGPVPASGKVFAGPTVGWSGLATATPLVAAGLTVDKLLAFAGHNTSEFLLLSAHLYAPLLTTLTGVLVFFAGMLLFGSRRRSLVLAFVYGLTTLAFPYTKIGMEPPLSFWLMAAVTAGIVARRTRSTWAVALCGTCAGFAAATRMPVAPILVLPVLAYAIWTRESRLAAKHLMGGLVPFVALNTLSFAYDNLRCGKLLCGLNQVHQANSPIYAGIYGFAFSPGKSLFVTSPVLLLAIPGVIRAWRFARAEAELVTALAVLGVLLVSPLSYWADEMYGPRYLLYLVAPSTLMIGYALGWRRGAPSPAWGRRFLAILALLGAVVQLAAVLPPDTQSPCATVVLPLLGRDRFDENTCRWVPQLSDVVLNLHLAYGMLRQDLGGGRTRISYTPYGGPPAGTLRTRTLELDLARPDVAPITAPSATHAAISGVFLALLVAGVLALAAPRWAMGAPRLLGRRL
jgi:hypothetical protein